MSRWNEDIFGPAKFESPQKDVNVLKIKKSSEKRSYKWGEAKWGVDDWGEQPGEEAIEIILGVK